MLSFKRPMLVVGGSSDQDLEGLGAFQEYPQVMPSAKSFISAGETISDCSHVRVFQLSHVIAVSFNYERKQLTKYAYLWIVFTF
jgi:hypothetical protein